MEFLRRLWSLITPRRTPTLPVSSSDDDVISLVLNECFRAGKTVIATRNDDGSVTVHSGEPEHDDPFADFTTGPEPYRLPTPTWDFTPKRIVRFAAWCEVPGGWWDGFCEDLPGLALQERTLNELKKSAGEVLAAMLDTYREDGMPVPWENNALAPSEVGAEHIVRFRVTVPISNLPPAPVPPKAVQDARRRWGICNQPGGCKHPPRAYEGQP